MAFCEFDASLFYTETSGQSELRSEILSQKLKKYNHLFPSFIHSKC